MAAVVFWDRKSTGASPDSAGGDSGSCCGDCTCEQDEETSHQTQAGKQSDEDEGGLVPVEEAGLEAG